MEIWDISSVLCVVVQEHDQLGIETLVTCTGHVLVP